MSSYVGDAVRDVVMLSVATASGLTIIKFSSLAAATSGRRKVAAAAGALCALGAFAALTAVTCAAYPV